MIARLNGRMAVLLGVCAVLVVVLVGWFAFVSPQRSKAASLDTQIGDTQVQLASTQAFLHSAAAHRSVVELRRLQKAIPNDVRMPEILRQLSAAADRAKVSITGITPAVLVPSAGGQAVPISLSVQGHYFGIANFLNVLRTRVVTGKGIRVKGRLFTVDAIQFSSGASDSVITATISLNAFVSTPAPVVVPTTTDTTTTTGQ
jgi:Tfp pilus assembly protein PilO